MTLNADNVVRVGRGSASTSSTSTAITVALDSGSTDADSVVFVGLFGEGLTFATPSGWAVVGTPANGLSVYRRGPVEGLAAGESSWNFTPSATAGKAVVAGALEVSGLSTADVVDVVGSVTQTTAGSSISSGATGQVTTYDGLEVVFMAHRDSANATPVTIGTYTATRDAATISSDEVLEQGQAGTGNSVDLAVSVATVQTIGSYGVTGQPSRTPLSSTAPGVGIAFVVNANGTRRYSDMFAIDGAEYGTTTGITVGASPYRLASSLSAGVTISGAAARSGSYGWAHDSTSAACNRVLDSVGVSITGTKPKYRRCFHLRGDTTSRRLWQVVMTTTNAAQQVMQLSLDATGKLLCATTGSSELSDTTVPTNAWFAVEVQMDCSAHVAGSSYTFKLDWAVDYDASLADTVPAVSQTQLTRTASLAGSISNFAETVGWTTAITSTMYTDDGVAAAGAAWPVGDVRVLPLKVDPSGTITVTTSTNFGVMTNNGTVAAWNATNARNAIDEVPPDLGGTRDALVALLASTTDHAKVPLETYDLAANKVSVRGFKWIMSLWAASATAATCRVAIYDGTTSRTVYAEADPNADNTSTPVWLSGVLRDTTTPIVWTQPIVDALEVWFGSNDATPDIGFDTVVGELVVVKAVPESLFGGSGDNVYIEAHRDPNTLALVGATATNNSGSAIQLEWEVDGVADTSGSIPNATSGLYVPISADGGIETVGRVWLSPG